MTPKEKCLYYGLPGIVILAVATFVTMRVSADFQHDTLIKFSTFIGSNALGLLLYFILQSQLQELSPLLPSFHPENVIYNKKSEEEAEPTNEELLVTNGAIAVEQDNESASEQSEPRSVQDGHPFTESLPTHFLFSSEQYRQRNEEMERERAEHQKNMLIAIAEYIQYTMSPYLREEDLPRLTDEIMAWATNPAHEPQEIPLKNNLLTTFDLRHFIWNIGERLGCDNGYTGENRAVFAKKIFPIPFEKTDIKSIMNFKAKSAKGDLIVIDEPDKRDFAFHYPTATKPTQTTAEQPQKSPFPSDLRMIRKLL